MINLENISRETLDNILNILYTSDEVLEFANATQEDEDYILGGGWTIWWSDKVLHVENSSDYGSAWID